MQGDATYMVVAARAACDRLAKAVAALQSAVEEEKMKSQESHNNPKTLTSTHKNDDEMITSVIASLGQLEMESRLQLRECSKHVESVRMYIRSQRRQEQDGNLSPPVELLQKQIDAISERRQTLALDSQAASLWITTNIKRGHLFGGSGPAFNSKRSNSDGKNAQAQQLVKSLKRTKNVVDEIVSSMMAANEILDKDAETLDATGRTHLEYGSVANAGDARLREIERLENSASNRMWWSFAFFCGVCGFIVLRRVPGLGLLLKILQLFTSLVVPSQPESTNAPSSPVIPSSAAPSPPPSLPNLPSCPRFPRLSILGQTAEDGIMPGRHENLVSSGPLWPKLEIKWHKESSKEKGAQQHEKIRKIVTSCVVGVWNEDVTTLAKPYVTCSPNIEGGRLEDAAATGQLIRLYNAPFVVDLQQYCNEVSGPCQVAAILCCGNQSMSKNATITVSMKKKQRPMKNDEEINNIVPSGMDVEQNKQPDCLEAAGLDSDLAHENVIQNSLDTHDSKKPSFVGDSQKTPSHMANKNMDNPPHLVSTESSYQNGDPTSEHPDEKDEKKGGGQAQQIFTETLQNEL